MSHNIQLIPGQRIHFIGIAGAGMSAIARILLLQGYQISGSDLFPNAATDALREEGARIYRGHDAAYIADAEVVIATSAVPDDHIEILSAQAQQIPVFRRADIMNAITDGYTVIAVAGTHGKTTTTSMITHILVETGQSPTYIIGGILSSTGFNADLGTGRAFVVEADEYGNMFHGLRPQVEVVTNIEYDHPDFFKTPLEMMESFQGFVGLLPAGGLLVACGDDPAAQIFARNRQVVNLPTTLYAIDNPADWHAQHIRYEPLATHFDVLHNGHELGPVSLKVLGKHNVLNAAAALAVADHEGVPFELAVKALGSFRGASRRFEVRDDVDGVAVVDDYAHHPTAIRMTIDAARQRYPDREIWAVWQPHTYSRTRQLWDDFLGAFDRADHIIVTDIYASRERPDKSVQIADFVGGLDHPDKSYCPTRSDVVSLLCESVKSPAVVLIMSAGDAPQIGIDFVHRLKAASQ